MIFRRSSWNSSAVARIGLCAAMLAPLAACSDRIPSIKAPLGLPPVPFPAEDRPTGAKISLGEKLFFDRRLSANGTMSCAMCHVPEQAFTVNELTTAVGIGGASLRRNAPTVLNIGYHPQLFHDGRTQSLEAQAWEPLLASDEMGNQSADQVLDRLRGFADYRGMFEAAFDGKAPSVATVGQALASYQRSLVSGDSRFDRYRYGGEPAALSDTEKIGYLVFLGKGRCAGCHLIGNTAALFSDFQFHNTGIGHQASRQSGQQQQVSVRLAADQTATLTAEDLKRLAVQPPSDLGRFEVTQQDADRWAYKTPMLRNVELTAPYMHDGSLPTLEAVIDYYDQGGSHVQGQSPLVAPIGMTPIEKRGLRAFLSALTGNPSPARYQRSDK